MKSILSPSFLLLGALYFLSPRTTTGQKESYLRTGRREHHGGAEQPTAPQADENGMYRAFVQYEKDGHDTMVQRFGRTAGCKVEYDFRDANTLVVTVTEEEMKRMQKDKSIVKIQADPKRYTQVMPSSDDMASTFHDLENLDDTEEPNHGDRRTQQSELYGIRDVQAYDAWAYSRGKGVKVCVIDSGFQRGHEDFIGNNIDGYTNLRDNLPWYQDGNGHGTHVTGTIAAANNLEGVVGVSPEAEIYVVRVFNNQGGFTYSSGLVDAAQRCVDAGAKIISMSLGGSERSDFEQDAFASFYRSGGVLSIAAAGNSGGGPWVGLSYPASYEEVISVAAVDRNKRRASFSQVNAFVDIAAPGVDIRSTYPTNRYRSLSGTSMATPHVSGVAALLWSFRPNASAASIQQALFDSAMDLGSRGRDDSYGWGLVQALDGLADLKGSALNDSDKLPEPVNPPPPGNSPPGQQCDPGTTSFRVNLRTDGAGWQTTLRLTRLSDGSNAFRGLFRSRREYEFDFCVVDSSCHEFAVRDVFNNGFGDGAYYKLTFDGEEIRYSEGDFAGSETTTFGKGACT
mmetsp:Transcript_23186/g.53797  ORF Transcript_23186/g.53797 Transcript_23186/m.53797 type:complete len:569 (-) Transcript_23186:1240-2946(-)|eukprot:CAMPEP_0116842892 /NCGR_PEP_ID=MMETSP0418-20121206/11774_1 /TAXON_ID=1158023 /ORGANISM="Astrosyne radiata, Strain 13vi08-1A" /LENGTH=568 /DNA_ID=CAMNT_0004473563 /DNA_START=258 /DNA_END=1964 /DNA_ORIENTATION=-